MLISKRIDNKNSNNKFKDKLLSFIIIISPILLQYHAVVLTYGLLLLMLVYLFLCIKYKKVFIDRDFIKLGAVLFVQEICSMIIFKTYSKNFINTIIMMEIICVVVVIGHFIKNEELLYNQLKNLAIISTFIVCIQFILHVVFKMPYKPLIFIPQNAENLKVWITNRPSAFFTEPQVYSTFMILVLMISLQKNKIFLSMFFFVGVLLSGSSSGIVVSLAVILYYLSKNHNIKFDFKIVIIITTTIIILSFFVMPFFSKYTQKIFSILKDISAYSKAEIVNSYSYTNYLRLFKSWQTFFDLPFKEKMVGVGVNNFSKYLNSTDVVFKWNNIWDNDARMAGYYSSAGGVFIDCGIIVAIYYYIFLIKKYISANSRISKSILVLLVIHSIYTQIFFNYIFLYYFLFYNAFLENSTNKEKDGEK